MFARGGNTTGMGGQQRVQSDPFGAYKQPVDQAAAPQIGIPGMDPIQQQMFTMAGTAFKTYAMGEFQKQMNDGKWSSWFSLEPLKDYFDVTNSYVFHKLRIILFPVTLKGDDWKRKTGGYDFNNEQLTPRGDIQAPDLYIPVMFFVTFILLTGFYLGNKDQFEPEALGYIYSKSLFLWLMEATALKGCFYFLGLGSGNYSPPFLELLSYTGYKFVGLCLIVITQLIFGNLASYGMLFVVGGLFSLFFFQTIRMHCQAGNTLAEHIKEVSMNRKTLTFVCAAGQLFMMWLLSIN